MRVPDATRGRPARIVSRMAPFGAAAIAIAAVVSPSAFAAGQERSAPSTLNRARVDEIDSRQRSDLARIDVLLANRQWAEAVDALERLAAGAPQRWIAVDRRPAGFVRYLSVADYCQARLASWQTKAPEALAIYRRRVDPRALDLWEKAIAFPAGAQGAQSAHGAQNTSLVDYAAAPDGRELLAKIVRELFASSLGDQALDRLAQMALDSGDYDAARRLWKQTSPAFDTPKRLPEELASLLAAPRGTPWAVALQGVDLDRQWQRFEPYLSDAGRLEASPDATEIDRGLSLVYPDTDLPLPQLWANLAMVSILQGEDSRAAIEVELLRRLHPRASGRVAGRDGLLVELLERLREESKTWPKPPVASDWPTFAGNFSRAGRAEHDLDPRARPLWSVSFTDRAAEGAVFPIVVGDVAMVFDGRYLRAWDLRTGAAWPEENQEIDPAGAFFDTQVDGSLPDRAAFPAVNNAAHHTLSADGRRLYVRLGGPIVQQRVAARRESLSPSGLAAFDWPTQRLLFRIAPPGDGWEFEGSPACRGDAIFVALRRTDQVQPQLYVAAYDALSGEPRLRSERICSGASASSGGGAEWPTTLVTCHEDAVYVSTNLGAIAALDAQSGRPRWLTTYPRSTRDANVQSELTPCLIHGGLLYVAPIDSDRVFALDAATGELVWRTRPGQMAGVRQLLGIGDGRLIVGGERLIWLDATSGRERGRFPAPSIDEPGIAGPAVRGFGRGLLAGENVYFPAGEAIYVFRQQTLRTTAGWLPQPVAEIDLAMRGATSGNLIAARDVLLIAGNDRLMAFPLPGRQNRNDQNHNDANRYARERP